MAIDWAGLLGAGLNAYTASRNASNNQQTATNYGNQTQYDPYNLSYGNASVGFSGNNATALLNPTYQGLQNQLTSGASGLLGGINSSFQNGGINPFLQGSFDQYNQQTAGPTQNLGGQFNTQASGFLGSLGSFDPNQAAQSYTSNLRSQAQPGNQQAAEGLAQQLFNTGRLGSTGGANVYGQLVQAQNQQDLGFQLAGQQYGGQEQNRLAGLASNLGGMGAQMNQQNFDQTNQRAQSRFQNAMSLFGAGQQNQQGQVQNSLGLLQGSQGLDQNLLQAIGLGGTLGAQRSGLNQSAYNPSLQAGVAANNTQGANISSLLNALKSSGMLDGINSDTLNGLLGNGQISPVTPTATHTPGYDPGAGPTMRIPESPTNPSAAGGEAASLGSATPSSLFGSSGASALGASAPVGAGAALSNLGGISAGGLFGTSGSAAAGAGAGSLGGGSLASVTGNAIPSTLGGLGTSGGASASAGAGSAASSGGALAGSGLSTAMPLAAIGWAIADAFNAKGDKSSGAVSSIIDGMVKQGGMTLVNPKNQTYKLQDGRFIQAGAKAKAVANAALSGDKQKYDAAMAAWLASANTDYKKVVTGG